MSELIKQIKVGDITYDIGVDINNLEGVRSIATGTTNGTISVNTNGTITDVAIKGLGSNAYTSTDYLPLSGGTVTGTLVLSKTTKASSFAYNEPALVVGGTSTQAHIEIDANRIIAKSNETKETYLYLGGDKGGIWAASGLACQKTLMVNKITTLNDDLYLRRSPNSSCEVYFRRGPNPTTTTWSDSTYEYTIDKTNGETDIAYISYSPSWAGKRVTIADNTTNDSFVNNGYLNFRSYSISSSTGEKLSNYYQFRLYPPTPADLTENKTFYFAVHTNSSISASTAKRYVVGISGAQGGLNYNSSVYTSGSVLYGACWNDYAEYRNQEQEILPGYIVYCDDNGKLKLVTQRLQKFEGVVSDTFGFSIGETEECKTPLAVSGRVLVYVNPEEEFHSGDCVCAGPEGRACRMTREEIMKYPDRIVGVVSEIPTYERWGTGNVEVDGRIWIRIR